MFNLTPVHPRTLLPIAQDIAADFSWREVFEVFLAGMAILTQATYAAGILTRRFVDGPATSAAKHLVRASSEALELIGARSRAWSTTPWAPAAPIAAVISVPTEALLYWLHAQLVRLVERLYPAAQSLWQQGESWARSLLAQAAYAVSA